jgi:hypothetical protein
MSRRRVFALVAAVVFAGVLGVPTAPAATATDVTDLDGACVALRAPSGSYVVRNALGGYQATSATPTQPFRLQSTGTASYLFYGTGEDFLGAGLGTLGVLSAGAAGGDTDWRLTAAGDAVTIATPGGRQLAVDPLLRTLALRPTATRFTLVPASGCATAPEAELNITGEPFTGTTPDGEVLGLADLHNHLTAYEFIGGEIHCGQPWSPYGITAALTDCPDHEPNGLGAWWENLAGGGYPTFTHDTQGWPTFADWPKHNSWTHEASYYKWVERAWRGGLRVYTNLFVNNAALCEIYPLKTNPCDDMASVRLQAQRIQELEAFIDDQHGGPGQGWFRIVRDPAAARAVIEQGKLAVVLGVEVSQPFGCGIRAGVPLCDRADIDAGLTELYDLGVRRMFVCHKFDNALCGVRFDGGTAGIVVNAANFYSTGRFWQAETCTGPAHDNTIAVANDLTDILVGPLAALLPPGVTLPVYPNAPHCNIHGLTDLGEYAMQGMIDRGMLIDIDHMSVKATGQALNLLEANDYPGVVSSHSWLDPSFYPRVYSLGGVVGPYGFGTTEFVGAWRDLKAMADPAHPFGIGAGFDTGGFGHQPPPRTGAQLDYPFRTFDGGSTVDRQRTGERVYDLNVDGMAHYGLLPDWLEDLRLAAGPDGAEIVGDMARGAEVYLRTWSAAASH